MDDQPRFAEGDLLEFAAACLRAHGMSDDDARIGAEALVASDLRGVNSHGLLLLARYCRQLQEGGVVARPELLTVRETTATALLDGGAGLGQVTAVKAMRLAMDKAAQHGVGLVSVRNSHHFGAAAHYAALALERGTIGLASTNAGVTMTAPGAAGRPIGNNPFAFAVPNSDFPFVLDMAMSQSSGGRIRRMAETGEEVPLGWLVDAEGENTTDPKDYPAGGALLPIGGHKGFGLALMVEILSAVLSGASTTTDVRIDTLEPHAAAGMGHLLLAIDIGSFRDLAAFGADLRHLLGKVAVPVVRPAGSTGVLRVPGRASAEKMARARQLGVPLPGDVTSSLAKLAGELNLPLPRPL